MHSNADQKFLHISNIAINNKDCAALLEVCVQEAERGGCAVTRRRSRRAHNKWFFMRFHLLTAKHFNRFRQPRVCACMRSAGWWFTKWHLSTHGLRTHSELSITHTWPVDPTYTNSAACLSWKRRQNTEISLWCKILDQYCKQSHKPATSLQHSDVFTCYFGGKKNSKLRIWLKPKWKKCTGFHIAGVESPNFLLVFHISVRHVSFTLIYW